MDWLRILHILTDAGFIAISSWTVAKRLRLTRRARRALGRDIAEHELTSISTWMEVESQEEKIRGYTAATSDNKHIS